MSEQSDQINELIEALSKAQGEIVGAVKDSKNPFFKSSYADLASVMEAIRVPFSMNGLAYVQTTEADDTGVAVTTTLAHKSGQWMRGKLRMMPKDATPQGIGSCITYARRYALAAIAGVAQIDDDAEGAMGRKSGTAINPRGELGRDQDAKKVQDYVSRFRAAFDADMEEAEVCALVYSIHTEIASDHDLYIAVGGALGSADSKKLKDCIAFHKKAKKAA